MSQALRRLSTATYRLTWWKLALALLAALLLYLCFPPADLGPLVWLALVPFFFSLTQVRPAAGALLGLVFGTCFILLYASYMLTYGVVGCVAIALFQGAFFALAGAGAAACNRCSDPLLRALGMAGAWTLAEFLRGSIGGLGFTLGDLGYTQHDQLPLLQTASIVGHYGLGFVIALLNSALTQAVLGVVPGVFLRPAGDPKAFAQRAARTVVSVYIVLFLLYFWGAAVMRADGTEETPPISVAAVQGSVPVEEQVTALDVKRSLDAYLQLSRTIPDETRLIVWPETAVPAALNMTPGMMAQIRETAVKKDAYLLAGGAERGESGETFNTLYFISPEGQDLDLYRKVLLVPFGEYVPQRERFPFLAKFAVRKFDFSPGDAHKILPAGDLRIGPLICFEALFPHVVRNLTRMGAQVLVFATSDEWAAGTPEVAQHSYTAPLRAVESRRYVIRAATWGISSIISPYGRVIADVPLYHPGVAWADVHARDQLSTYHRIGDLPLVVFCFAVWLATVLACPRTKASPPKEE